MSYISIHLSLSVVCCQNCESSVMCSVKNDAATAEVDATQRHVETDAVLETLHMDR